MVAPKRSPTPAEAKWSQYVNAEHLSPVVIRVFIQLGTAAPGGEDTRAHIEQCDECASMFTALMSKKGDDVVLDYAYETREALRLMWATTEKQVADLRKQFAAIRNIQWWTLVGVAALIVLRLWPSLAPESSADAQSRGCGAPLSGEARPRLPLGER